MKTLLACLVLALSLLVAGPALAFDDVPPEHPFAAAIASVTGDHWGLGAIMDGCPAAPIGADLFCPDDFVTRAEIAVFLLKALVSPLYHPPTPLFSCSYDDMSMDDPACPWIKDLRARGITHGCSATPPLYCPDELVSRAQVAVFILRARHGREYVPPPAVGLFADTRPEHPVAAWVEAFAREGLTSGCGAGLYCPDDPVTRGELAAFLSRAFPWAY